MVSLWKGVYWSFSAAWRKYGDRNDWLMYSIDSIELQQQHTIYKYRFVQSTLQSWNNNICGAVSSYSMVVYIFY